MPACTMPDDVSVLNLRVLRLVMSDGIGNVVAKLERLSANIARQIVPSLSLILCHAIQIAIRTYEACALKIVSTRYLFATSCWPSS